MTVKWLRVLGVTLALLLGAKELDAGQLDATWTAPTTNVDGTPLTTLDSFRVYWYLYPAAPCPGTQFFVVPTPANAPPPNTQIAAHIGNLTANMTYNVQVTAVNQAGNESACSNTASGVARPDAADVKPGVVANAKLVFTVPPPPPPGGPTFTTVGLVAGQTVTGILKVSNVPKFAAGQTFNFFTYVLAKSGVTVFAWTEYGAPYCFNGDALGPCGGWDSKTQANGAYTLTITLGYAEGGVNKTTFTTFPLTIAN